MTPSGEKPIASLKVGDQVIAYNPTTGQDEVEPVQHVWINHDHDLVDVRVSIFGRPGRLAVEPVFRGRHSRYAQTGPA